MYLPVAWIAKSEAAKADKGEPEIRRGCGKSVANGYCYAAPDWVPRSITRPLRDERESTNAAQSCRYQSPLAQPKPSIAARGKLQIVRHQNGGQGVFALQRLQQHKDALGGSPIQIAGRFICE